MKHIYIYAKKKEASADNYTEANASPPVPGNHPSPRNKHKSLEESNDSPL